MAAPGTHNEPQVASSDPFNPPADMNAIAAFAKAVGNIKVGTRAARNALGGADVWDGLKFVETDYPTEWVRRSGGWSLANIPTFTSTGDRDTAIPSPSTGDRAFVGTVLYVYSGGTWVPLLRDTTYATRASAIIATGATLNALDFGAPVGSDFTESSGVFTCVTAGTYLITLTLIFGANSTSIRGIALAPSVGSRRAKIENAVSAGIEHTITIAPLFALAAGQTVTAQALQSSGGNLAVAGDIVFQRIAA